ncbi:TRAP transporter large permease subunit [Chelonobacter oris]|uniref:TRAP transporter large permease subunit n=1 Tax=Chelonobacter oris TaxID=505317 RepID=UPI000A04831A|nr:TRAP transporter large permease subunit [Chelonobacter oris]
MRSSLMRLPTRLGIGAYILVGVYNLVGGNHFVESLLVGSGLPPIGIILIMMLILLVLGLFFWFGVLFCVNMQVSFLSPPFGPAAFYLHSVAPEGIELVDIFKSVLPFILLQIILLTLLILFPDIALFLVK